MIYNNVWFYFFAEIMAGPMKKCCKSCCHFKAVESSKPWNSTHLREFIMRIPKSRFVESLKSTQFDLSMENDYTIRFIPIVYVSRWSSKCQQLHQIDSQLLPLLLHNTVKNWPSMQCLKTRKHSFDIQQSVSCLVLAIIPPYFNGLNPFNL